MTETAEGIVLRSTGSWYDVDTGDEEIACKVRGRFRLDDSSQTNPVVVGDRVTIRKEDDGTGLIVERHPRKNRLARRAAGRRVGIEHVIAANIDMAWVVQAVMRPSFNPGFVDRFLVMAGVDEIPAGIVINKMDLAEGPAAEDVEFWTDLYVGIGYPVVHTSAKSGDGCESLREALSDSVSVIAGPSGAGKSSLLNAVQPGLELKTGAVSRKTRKGKHTTTFASLHPLEIGGYVVDTPGLREFGLVDLDPPHLSHYMPEMAALLHDCKFPNCTHDHEPGCAVKEGLDDGLVSPERYRSYVSMLDSLRLGHKDVGR